MKADSGFELGATSFGLTDKLLKREGCVHGMNDIPFNLFRLKPNHGMVVTFMAAFKNLVVEPPQGYIQ
jgi:hypothetical protein